MYIEEYSRLKKTVRILRDHCSGDYNNTLQINIAQKWFEDTLSAIYEQKPLPDKPIELMDWAL